MPSPPTFRVSTDNPTRHSQSQQQRRFELHSSSFHPFRKESQPVSANPTEQYEVAPGILNTDATAIVFGYLDREQRQKAADDKNKKRKISKRTKTSGPRVPSRTFKRPGSVKRTHGRSRSPIKEAYDRYKEVHADDGTDNFTTRTHRQHVEASTRARHEKRDDSKRIWKERQDRSKRGRNMVSEDDKLQSRGANPRTGIVTPYVTSEEQGSSGDSGYGSGRGGDYLRVRAHQGPVAQQGSWRQDEKGWSLVEDQGSLLTREKIMRKDVRKVEGFRVLHPPAEDTPEVRLTGAERVLRHQQTVRRAAGDGNQAGTMDPRISPMPSQWTPEGPRSSGPKLGRISRKKVGSGVMRREESEDTVVINGRLRAASVPPQHQCPRPRPRVRILTPNNSSQGVNLGGTAQAHSHTSRSFLELLPGTSQILYPSHSAVPARNARFPGHQGGLVTSSSSNQSLGWAPHRGQAHDQYQENVDRHMRAGFSLQKPTAEPLISLPKLPSPHLSQIPDIAATYHHRQYIETPISLEATIATNAHTPITITTTTTPSAQMQRPKPHRQEGSKTIPQVIHRNCEQMNYDTKTLPPSPASATTGGYAITTMGHDRAAESGHVHTRSQHCRPPQQPQGGSFIEHKPQIFATTATIMSTSPIPPAPIEIDDTTVRGRLRGETYNGWVVPDAKTVLDQVPRQHPSTLRFQQENGRQKRCGPPADRADSGTCRRRTSAPKGMKAGSGNAPPFVGDPRAHDRGHCPEICLEEDTRSGAGSLVATTDDEAARDTDQENQPQNPGRLQTCYTCRSRDAVLETDVDLRPIHSIAAKPQAQLLRRRKGSGAGYGMRRSESLTRRVQDIKMLVSPIEFRVRFFSTTTVLRHVVRGVIVMVHHVLTTLHCKSQALRALQQLEVERQEYWAAVGDVLLAGWYVVVGVYVVLILWRVLRVAVGVWGVVAVPGKLVWGWCFGSW